MKPIPVILDTCGLVVLNGEKYKRVLHCEKPLIKALMENYKIWLLDDAGNKYQNRSSTLRCILAKHGWV